MIFVFLGAAGIYVSRLKFLPFIKKNKSVIVLRIRMASLCREWHKCYVYFPNILQFKNLLALKVIKILIKLKIY